MKKYLRLFLLITGCCLIHCVLFGQYDINKIYQVKFSGFKTHLSKEAKATLNDVAETLRNQPNIHYAISSCPGTENQRFNQVTWDRVNKIVIHLVEKLGINADRLVFKYDEGKDCNTINITFTEDSITTDPPPHPSLRKKNQ